MTYDLYLITNKITKQQYVGQTIDTNGGYLRRFKQHINESFSNRRDTKSSLHNAIRKYGADNFTIIRILKNIPEESIDYYEILWISKLHTYYKYGGYNLTHGGQGVHGYLITDDIRKKLSNASKSYWNFLANHPDEYEKFIAKRKQAQQNKPLSYLHKKHLSESVKNTYANGRKPNFKGCTHTVATKQRIAEMHSKCVYAYDTQTITILYTFDSIKVAATWLVEYGYTTNVNASARISYVCNRTDKWLNAYGFYWSFERKCNDYSDRK